MQALQGLDLLVAEGELIAIVGASGSGKSTLLNMLAGLDAPTAGRARVAGHDLLAMTRARPARLPARHVVGFVWQQTHRNLLPYLTGRRTSILPMRFAGAARRGARPSGPRSCWRPSASRTAPAATPDQMSGGEQQRVAIAIALANQPRVLLADEPTGELDSATAQEVFAALRTANGELGVTVVVVTHDPAVSGQVRAHGRDPRRADQQRGAAPRRRRRARDAAGQRGGVRGAGPRRAGAAAPRDHRGARHDATGCGWRRSPTTSASGPTAPRP